MRHRFFVAAVGFLTMVAVNVASYPSEAEAGRHRGRRARCGSSCGYSGGCAQGGCNTGACNTGGCNTGYAAPVAAPAGGQDMAPPPAPATTPAPGAPSPSDQPATPAPGV